MKTANQYKYTPVSAYHENDSLLLQFILSEFLLVYREVRTLHSHFADLQAAIEKRRPNTFRKEIFCRFIFSLETLSGASRDTMRLFSWGQEDGILHKFNSYAALFSRRSGVEAKEEQSFYRAVNQSLLISIQLHDLALTVSELPHSQWKSFLLEIEQLEAKISSNAEKFSKHLSKIIQKSSNDENVIFFVLRHANDFDALFQSGYTKKLLSKIGKGSLDTVESSLIKKYRKRGFTQLLPIINERFDLLKSI